MAHDSCMYSIGLDTINCRSKVTIFVKLGDLIFLLSEYKFSGTHNYNNILDASKEYVSRVCTFHTFLIKINNRKISYSLFLLCKSERRN